MRNILLLTVNTIRLTLSRKSTVIIFFLLPVLGVLLSVGIYSGAGTVDLRIGIVDLDGGVIAKDMTDAIENTGNNKTVVIREDEIKEELLNGNVSVVFTIPEGFTDNIAAGETVDIQLASVKGEEVTAWLENFTNFYLKNIADMAAVSGGDRQSFERMYDNFADGSLRFSVGKVDDRTTSKSVTLQSLGFLIMFVLLGAYMASELILREKRSRTYHRICAGPVNSRSYVAGNVIANMLIVLFQNILIIFVVIKILGINTFIPDMTLLLILMCFGTVAVSIPHIRDRANRGSGLFMLILYNKTKFYIIFYYYT